MRRIVRKLLVLRQQKAIESSFFSRLLLAKSASLIDHRSILVQVKRSFSSAVPEKQKGAGLLHRISSFLVGAGLTALITQLYLFDDIRQGNRLMLEKQKEIESRLAKLEKK
jgi:hypothetical protein